MNGQQAILTNSVKKGYVTQAVFRFALCHALLSNLFYHALLSHFIAYLFMKISI